MGLSGQRRKQLQEALIDAFPTTASLEQMLAFELEKNLRVIAGEGSLQEIVFKLIQAADTQGWVEDLIRGACQSNPGNLRLKIIVEGLSINHEPETTSSERGFKLKTPNLEEIESSNAKRLALLKIPVTDSEASEIGANYTKLRNLFIAQEFGEADEETAAIILWAVKREQEGWLRKEDIENFPSLDLCTINKLWLAGSDERFGFSIQKQIWIDVGGNPREYDHETFKRFLKSVEWEEENKVIFDLRAKRGHLPLGMYLKITVTARLNQKWWTSINKYQPQVQTAQPPRPDSMPYPRLIFRSKVMLVSGLLIAIIILILISSYYLGFVLLITSLLLIWMSVLYVFSIYRIWEEEKLARKMAQQKLEREIRESLPYFFLFSRTDI